MFLYLARSSTSWSMFLGAVLSSTMSLLLSPKATWVILHLCSPR